MEPHTRIVMAKRVADRWVESRKVNRKDPGSLMAQLKKLVQRDHPDAEGAARQLATKIQRMWPQREEPEDKPRNQPHLNKEKASSVLEYLRWLLVEKNGLDDLTPDLMSFSRALA